MNTSDVIAIIGLVGSFVGIPVTFIVARRARLRPELRYAIDFTVLLEPSDSLFDQGLRMSLRDQEINRISRTRVAIWNNHGDPIKKSDIVSSDPLRIALKSGDRLLQSRVISASRKQIALTGTIDKTSGLALRIDFDFLAADDGGVIEIVHQGLKPPEILGTLRSSPIISNGSTKLDPDALADIAGKSLPYRMRKFVVRHAGGILLALLFIGGLSYSVISDAIPALFGKPGPLIDSKNYNLNTPAGQVKFVKAVTNTNYYNSATNDITTFAFGNKALSLTIILGLIFLLAILGLYLVYDASKKRIPANIALYRDTADITDKKPSSPSPQILPPEDHASLAAESNTAASIETNSEADNETGIPTITADNDQR